MRDAAREKRLEREAKRNQGFVLKQIWVKPDAWPKIKAAIARMLRH